MQKLFEKNLKFFYENIPSYYKLITSIKKRNFQIKNDNLYHNGNPVYPNSITIDSKTISTNPLKNPLWEKSFFINPDFWDEKEFYATGKVINSFMSKEKNYAFESDFLPTTILFGLLSGKHLQNLVEKYYFQSLFIYEPNPEFFAISLYFVDYEKLYTKLDKRLFLWIGGEIDYFAIEKFFYERVVTSSFLNIYYKAYEHPLINDAIAKFSNIQASKLRGWGTYEDEMKGIKKHKKNINKYPILEEKRKINAPICVIANGKSLEDSIEFIKKNRDSIILVSVGTAIKPLLKHDIQPDFHIEQERIDILPDVLKDTLPFFNGYFLGASVVDEKVFKMAKKPLMFIREAFTLEDCYKPLIGSSPIVGNAGFAFAANFTDEIYLCGMDLGFKIGQKKHASGSFYDDRDDTAKSGIKIKGNFDEYVYTDSLFLSSKDKIEKMIEMFNLKVYNLSKGAYIKGAQPLKDKNLPKIDKEKVISQMLKAFKTKKYPPCNVDTKPLIKALKEAFKLKISNQKELTGAVDFIEDLVKEYAKIDKKTFTLLKGSIFHILINFYALSFSKDPKEMQETISENLDVFSK
ncbi:MAG: motility associated factor glycosyltransferase family protein [Epsilonproteobacteria bacterium]|nr:motility associated factor glycosyltransferase family protein [Campylobacterota bacterium]